MSKLASTLVILLGTEKVLAVVGSNGPNLKIKNGIYPTAVDIIMY